MPLTFPLTAAEFMQQLLIEELRFDDPENVETNLTGGGETMRSQLAPQLWVGEARMGVMTRREMAQPDVLLSVLRRPGASFYAYDTRRAFPLMDPTGTILGGSFVGIAALPNARELSLSSLPPGYVLSRGDYLSFDYGTGAGQRALHRVVDLTVTANGAGVTPLFEVTPLIRSNAILSGVTLIRASCKAVLVAGSADKGSTTRFMNSGMNFRLIQTLR
jgi:hypothetical protein